MTIGYAIVNLVIFCIIHLNSNFMPYHWYLDVFSIPILKFEGYIYHPKTEKCYPSHRQGPCENKHHLMLPPNSVVPVCQENPCADNFVQYKGKCYELDKVGPCDLRIHFSNVIGVNETTLEIICTQDYKMNIPPSVGLRLGDEDEDTENSTAIKVENGERLVQPCTLYKQKRCFVGGIRWTRTICPTQISANEVDGQIQSSMVVSPAWNPGSVYIPHKNCFYLQTSK